MNKIEEFACSIVDNLGVLAIIILLMTICAEYLIQTSNLELLHFKNFKLTEVVEYSVVKNRIDCLSINIQNFICSDGSIYKTK